MARTSMTLVWALAWVAAGALSAGAAMAADNAGESGGVAWQVVDVVQSRLAEEQATRWDFAVALEADGARRDPVRARRVGLEESAGAPAADQGPAPLRRDAPHLSLGAHGQRRGEPRRDAPLPRPGRQGPGGGHRGPRPPRSQDRRAHADAVIRARGSAVHRLAAAVGPARHPARLGLAGEVGGLLRGVDRQLVGQRPAARARRRGGRPPGGGRRLQRRRVREPPAQLVPAQSPARRTTG